MSMPEPLTRGQLLHAIQEDWGKYLARYQALSTEEQQAFLQRQGFDHLQDLLAHVVAWWEECFEVVTPILDGLERPRRKYDIDQFNAEAVARYRDWTLDDLLIHFENLRQILLDLASELPDEALVDRRVAVWLYACVVEHARAHWVSA
jgi:hypothetical protein